MERIRSGSEQLYLRPWLTGYVLGSEGYEGTDITGRRRRRGDSERLGWRLRNVVCTLAREEWLGTRSCRRRCPASIYRATLILQSGRPFPGRQGKQSSVGRVSTSGFAFPWSLQLKSRPCFGLGVWKVIESGPLSLNKKWSRRIVFVLTTSWLGWIFSLSLFWALLQQCFVFYISSIQ